jgi:hypothetical protein
MNWRFWDRYKQLSEHYRGLYERFEHQANWYQGLLYHSWRVIRQQNKGLNRQARKIKRLQAEIKVNNQRSDRGMG